MPVVLDNFEAKAGDLRVYWIPQVPMEPFYARVSDLTEAHRILGVLAEYDEFQYKNKIKPDYCNAGGIQEYEPDLGGWMDLDEGVDY